MIEDIEKSLSTIEREKQEISFEVKEDFVKELPQILSNCKQLKQWAINQTANDKTLILVTDEDYDNAKKRCAEINKVIKQINDKRLQVKKQYIAPFEIFEKEVKEVSEVLSEAKDNLWTQIKESQEKEEEAKYELLKEKWEEITKDNQYRTIKDIFNSKWLNRTVKIETAEKEMRDIQEQILSDIAVIKTLSTEDEIILIENYKDGHSLKEVLFYAERLKQARQKQQELQNTQKQATESKEEKQAVENQIPPQSQTDSIETLVIDFRVECTREQLRDLGQYMKENGIKYGKVPKGE